MGMVGMKSTSPTRLDEAAIRISPRFAAGDEIDWVVVLEATLHETGALATKLVARLESEGGRFHQPMLRCCARRLVTRCQ